jgi:hypothetical protein
MLRLLLPRGLQVVQCGMDPKPSLLMFHRAQKMEHPFALVVAQLSQLMSQPFIEQAGSAPCSMQRQQSSPPHASHTA